MKKTKRFLAVFLAAILTITTLTGTVAFAAQGDPASGGKTENSIMKEEVQEDPAFKEAEEKAEPTAEPTTEPTAEPTEKASDKESEPVQEKSQVEKPQAKEPQAEKSQAEEPQAEENCVPAGRVLVGDVLGIARLQNFMPRTLPGGDCIISPGSTHHYGDWLTHEYPVTTGSGTYLGYCAQPTKGSPSGVFNVQELFNYDVKRLLMLAPGGPLYNKMGHAFWNTYGYNPATGGADGNDAFSLAHACIGYVYDGKTTGLSDTDISEIQAYVALSRTYFTQDLMNDYKVFAAFNDGQDIVWIERYYTDELNIGKESSDTRVPLPGAVFKLYSWSDHYATPVATARDNGNGTYTFPKLEFNVSGGNYLIREVSAPAGYTTRYTTYSTDDKNSYNSWGGREIQYTVENGWQPHGSLPAYWNIFLDPPKECSVTVSKTDGKTGDALSGAEFTVYAWDGSGYNNNLGKLSASGSTHSKSGLKYTTVNQGRFKILETKAPSGYTGNWSKEFAMNAGGADNQTFTFTATNTPWNGKVTLTKTDVDTGAKLKGGEFRVYAWNGSSYATDCGLLTDNGNGTYTGTYTYSKTNQGRHRVVETKAPAGYDGNWSGNFTITAADQRITMAATNKAQPVHARVTVVKKDKATDASLAGAEFSIYEWDSAIKAYKPTVLQKLVYTTIRNRYETATSLLKTDANAGKFKVVETKNPAGYIGAWEKEFVVTEQPGETQEFSFTVVNTHLMNLTINKVITKDDIWWAHGEPTFTFRVSGTDIDGKSHTYHRAVTFTKEYVDAHTAADGSIQLSTVIHNIPCGSYAVEEQKVSRFALTNVTAQTDNVAVTKEETGKTYEDIKPITANVTADLTAKDGEVTFYNRKITWDEYSHNDVVTNTFTIHR